MPLLHGKNRDRAPRSFGKQVRSGERGQLRPDRDPPKVAATSVAPAKMLSYEHGWFIKILYDAISATDPAKRCHRNSATTSFI